MFGTCPNPSAHFQGSLCQKVPACHRPRKALEKALRLEEMKFFKEKTERQAETLTLFKFILLVTACFAETYLRPWASRCYVLGERNNPTCLQSCSTHSAGTRECSSFPVKKKKKEKKVKPHSAVSPSRPVNADAGTNRHWAESTQLCFTVTFQTPSRPLQEGRQPIAHKERETFVPDQTNRACAATPPAPHAPCAWPDHGPSS